MLTKVSNRMQEGLPIAVSSRADMKAFDVPAGFQFSLEEGGRSGLFVVKSGTPPSDPEEGVYVVLSNGNYAERIFSDKINVQWFGAQGDEISDDTDAINAALDHLSANKIDSRGLGKVYLPRGVYLCNGEISVNSPLTLIFEGDGPEATKIARTNDSGVLFKFQTYIYLEFKDLRLEHNTESERGTWTNTAIELSGTGGGRKFLLRRVETSKFNKIVDLISTVNQDTNHFEGVTALNFNTFLRVRNSQALINKVVQCSFFGDNDRVFDIYGFGYTHFDTINCVTSGTFLYIASGTTSQSSQYLVSNAKFEFWNGTDNTNGTTKIVEVQDANTTSCFVKFQKSGIEGGNPDPSIYQFDLQGRGFVVDVEGGTWAQTKIRTKGYATGQAPSEKYVRFKDCTTSPSTTIERLGSGTAGVPVVFENCVGVSNVFLQHDGTNLRASVGVNGANRNINTVTGNQGFLVLGVGTPTFAVENYGQPVFVESIKIATRSPGSAWQGREIKAFSDAALTQQIGSTITPAAFSGNKVFEIDVSAGVITEEGVYVTVQNTNGASGVGGTIQVDTLSI